MARSTDWYPAFLLVSLPVRDAPYRRVVPALLCIGSHTDARLLNRTKMLVDNPIKQSRISLNSDRIARVSLLEAVVPYFARRASHLMRRTI